MNKFRLLLLLSFISLFQITHSQQKHLTIQDAVLGYYKGLYPRGLSGLQWLKDQDELVYRDGNTFLFINSEGEELNRFTGEEIQKLVPDMKRLPYLDYIDSNKMVFSHSSNTYIIDYRDKRLTGTIHLGEKSENTDYCAKNNMVAYTLDNNLYLAGTGKKTIVPVTKIDDKNIVSGQAIHRNEFGIQKGTFWSPEGHYLAFYQKDESRVSDYPLVDITTYPASLKPIKYPMAGQGSEQAKVGVFDIQTRKLHYLDIDTSDEHYLTNLAWSPDEQYILLAEVNRAQDHMWFNVYEAKTGRKIRTLFEEQNDKWVEPETPAVFIPGSTDTFLWLSERNGYMNVYQYHLQKGLMRQITDFPFVVTSLLGFNADKTRIIVAATGEDPKEEQVYEVPLSGGKAKQITRKQGRHRAKLSPSGKYLLDAYTSPDIPLKQGIITIGQKDCKILKEVENPLKEYPSVSMEFITLKAVDGTPLEARVIKPGNFDSQKKYPVLVYVYGGPHAQLVTDSWMGGASLWMYYLAQEKGYIVFTVDGRGSANRGFAFESVIHRQQGKAAMEDQMTGVEYLKSLPYVDADHMAIFGWSYGGFMTISMMLHHPGVFTTAVAGGPVTDWKYYEVMYGERYMDTPQENPQGYREARLPDYIDQLKGRLLVIHGSIDPVVVPQHSMTLLKAAVDKNIPIDFFTYPMHEHNVRGMDRVHLMEKVIGYILEHNK